MLSETQLYLQACQPPALAESIMSTMDIDTRPGLNPRRLVQLMNATIDACRLDLADRTVMTEAASGAYVVTPVLAALAGAHVFALAAATSYATADEIRNVTVELARLAGVVERVQLIYEKSPAFVGAADIVTNSGQVRPIDAMMVSRMKSSAVIPLMYEKWEYRAEDVDLEACRLNNIPVAGTNERHPDVGMFSYLGAMAVKQLHDAGIAVYRSRIVLLCDNAFGSFIVTALRNCGAEVTQARQLTPQVLAPHCDAVLLAMRPGDGPVFTAADVGPLAGASGGTVLVQYWGDVDRASLAAAGVPVWPPHPPAAGHMGVLPSAIGPEPVIRLQAGGLKVGELLARGLHRASPDDLTLVQPL
jgi:hypothetical protein